jgi:protein SCO1/2
MWPILVQTSSSVLRLAFALIFAISFLSACGPSGPKFRNADITGAEYGRDLALTDHSGKARTLADFRGKVVVMFFGFMRCPDVCPTTLAELKLVLEELGADASRVQVLFITLDPERDTPDLLAQYVTAFDPSFLGLYGDMQATARVAKEFKIYYRKAPGLGTGEYSIDHSAGSYVIDPQGRLRLYVSHGQAAGLAADLRLLLKGA